MNGEGYRGSRQRGAVYFIQIQQDDGKGPVKIGFTTGHPSNRRQDLQTASPYPLRLIWPVQGPSP